MLSDRGVLRVVDVTADSGSPPLDKAVVDAFRIAGPYPNPPEQLVNEQGQVILPDFAFTVELGHAKAIYQGVDPRQGVQFPGIMKATR